MGGNADGSPTPEQQARSGVRNPSAAAQKQYADALKVAQQSCADAYACGAKVDQITAALQALQQERTLYQDDPAKRQQIEAQAQQLLSGVTKDEWQRARLAQADQSTLLDALAFINAPTLAGDIAGALARIGKNSGATASGAPIERGFGSNVGHDAAGSVTEGGSGQALAGHGVMDGSATLLGNGQFVVPSGTIVVTPRPGIAIADSTGRILENVTSVEQLEQVLASGVSPTGEILTPRNYSDLAGYVVIRSGEKGYNFTLLNPGFQGKPLNIFSKSTTTVDPAQLSSFLQPNMGCIFWAACTLPVPYIPK